MSEPHNDEMPVALLRMEEKPGLWSQGRVVGTFGSTAFTLNEASAISRRLNENLTKAETCTRPGPGGVRLTYIEGWKVIQEANLLFGFNGWTQTVLSTDIRFIEEIAGSRYSVCVSALVRVTLRDGSAREDRGGGTCDGMRSKGDAILKAEKEAITDATKRALKNFGPRLGLCLYDKISVREMNRQPPRGMASSGWAGGANGRGPPHGQGAPPPGQQRGTNGPQQQRAPPLAQTHNMNAPKQEHAYPQPGQHPRAPANNRNSPGSSNVAVAVGKQQRAPNMSAAYNNRNAAPNRNIHSVAIQHGAPDNSTGQNVVAHRNGTSSSHQQRASTTSNGQSNRNVAPQLNVRQHQGPPRNVNPNTTPQRNVPSVAGQQHQNATSIAPRPQLHAPYAVPQVVGQSVQQHERAASPHHRPRPKCGAPSRRTSHPGTRNPAQNGDQVTAQYPGTSMGMQYAGQGQQTKAYVASPVTPAGQRRPVANSSRPTPQTRSGNLLNTTTTPTPNTKTTVGRAQPMGNTRVVHGMNYRAPHVAGVAGVGHFSRAHEGMAQYAGTKRPNSAMADAGAEERERRRQREEVVEKEIRDLQNMRASQFE